MSTLSTRLLLGALAGLTATTAMTACMARLEHRLPPEERYPLPPREITGALVGEQPPVDDLAVAAHFAFGGLMGALLAALRLPARPAPMAAAGLGIWTASYFGWIPALGILRPASSHPARRNVLMAGVHLVWGAATALTLAELTRARRSIFATGPAKDR